MRSEWPTEGESGYAVTIPASVLPVLVLAACVVVVGIVVVGFRLQTMNAELAELRSEMRDAARRESDLEAMVARQHKLSQERDAELETLRFQMAAVEMQLDGVDFLSQQLRAELGLPPSAASWTGTGDEERPQGGAGAVSGSDGDRLALAQRRLAAGLADMYQLLELARARRASAATSEETEPSAVAEIPADLDPPVNWPARGGVTSSFGWRTFRGVPNFHTGIDVALPYGSEVLATGQGMVLGSGWQPGYGLSVLVQHADGYNTLYAHLSDTLVDIGDRVTVGDPVGLSGSSGNSTGPHLHYEIWKDGQLVDPRPFMDGTGRQ